MSNRIKRLIGLTLGAVVFAPVFQAQAQNTTNPYSAYGIGELSDQAFSRNAGMGGVGIATTDLTSFNRLNPANLSDIVLTTIDFTGFYSAGTIQQNDIKQARRFGGIQGLSFAFPTRKKLRLGFGIAPLSSVGYDFGIIRDVVTGSTTTSFISTVKSEGGISEVFGSAAQKFMRGHLAVGVSGGVLFGTENTQFTTGFLDGSSVVTVRDQRSLSGFRGSIGVTWQDTLRKVGPRNIWLWKAGMVYRTTANLNGQQRILSNPSTKPTATADQFDTLATNRLDRIVIPGSFGIGIGIEQLNKLSIGVDFTYADWSGLSYNRLNSTPKSQFQVKLGVEYTPDIYSAKYLKRIAYRAGVKYDSGYLRLNDTNGALQNIPGYAVTAGLGFPLNRNYSKVNLGVAYGLRGNNAPGLIQETTFQVFLGINFNELWFIKRVYE